MPLDDPLTLTLIALAVIVACSIVLYAMRKRGGKREKSPEKPELEAELKGFPFKISKTVQSTDASRAKEELRILDLEREILSDAIRRLYEAHAEGKITEQEREKLAGTYKSRMMTVKDAISKDETLVALHELEGMQEDLIKLFSERFGELSAKVDELRTKVEVKPIKELKIPAAAEAPSVASEAEEKPEAQGKAKKKRKPSEKASPRAEAEKRIEEIRTEVEKVLERLGQMEIEG